MEDKLLQQVDEKIKEIMEEDINSNNLDYLYKLSKIKHITKEDKMNYGNYGEYGRRAGYDSYGEHYGRDNYGRRGYDAKYRGHNHLDRMYEDYGRYMDGRTKYGNNQDTMKSLKYMLESMEDFARMLKEDAQSQEEVEMIRQTAQRIAQM